MGLLNRLRGKTKKNNWRKRPNIIRSADYLNTKPSVNKSRIIGISSAKASPTQGLQNWFTKTFTRKQKPNKKKEEWKQFKMTPMPVAPPHRNVYRSMNLSNNPFQESNNVRNLKGISGSTPAEQTRRNLEELRLNQFNPNFPIPAKKEIPSKEKDPFGNLSGYNAFQNNSINRIKANRNRIRTRRNILAAKLKQLQHNPFTNNANVDSLTKETEELRAEAIALKKRANQVRNKSKNM